MTAADIIAWAEPQDAGVHAGQRSCADAGGSMSYQNPFAQLVAQLRARQRCTLRQTAAPQQPPASKTGAMRSYLQARGKATAADLAIEAGLENTGLVGALLKADIAKGAIERRGDHYHWVDTFDQEQHRRVQSAIRTLRAAGYTVKRSNA